MMKKILCMFLSALLLLSLFACGKTEATEKEADVPNDQTENNNQQKPDHDPEDPVPTDPVSKEVYDLKHDEKLTHASLSFYEVLAFAPEYEPYQGSVEILDAGTGPRLHLMFVIPKTGENSFDATIGYNPDDMSDYHFSFKLYLKEQGIENAEYKTTHTNLVLWLIIDIPSKMPIYHCTFYNSGLLDIVEVGKTYDTVIAIYENNKVVGWCEDELIWYEDSQEWVEKAEQYQEVIK